MDFFIPLAFEFIRTGAPPHFVKDDYDGAKPVAASWPWWHRLWCVLRDPWTFSSSLSIGSGVAGLFLSYILCRNSAPTPVTLLAPLALFLFTSAYAVLRVSPGRAVPREYILRAPALMKGKTAIVTGGNTGIGKATVGQLAQWGCRVISGCRDVQKGHNAVRQLVDEFGVDPKMVEVVQIDLADLESVKRFTDHWKKQKNNHIDFLICNAGVMGVKRLEKTKAGHEIHFCSNHLGHFLLTVGLKDEINKAGGRVISVSSHMHVFAPIFNRQELERAMADRYNPIYFYALSKTANILFSKALNLHGYGTGSYVMMPGNVQTELQRHVGNVNCGLGRFTKRPLEGAQTILYLCLAPTASLDPFKLYADCKTFPSATSTCDAALAMDLWEWSREMVNRYLPEELTTEGNF